MLLYRVVITWDDVARIKEYEAGIEKLSGCAQRLKIDEYPTPPERKKHTAYAVVPPAPDDMVALGVGRIVVEAIVGPQDCWGKYYPLVESIDLISSSCLLDPCLTARVEP